VAQLHAEDLRGAGDCSWEKSSRKWEYPWEKLQETGDFHQVIQWFSPKMVDFVVISWEIMEICYLKIVGKPYRFHVFFPPSPRFWFFSLQPPRNQRLFRGFGDIWKHLGVFHQTIWLTMEVPHTGHILNQFNHAKMELNHFEPQPNSHNGIKPRIYLESKGILNGHII
jgi:hypothetical protein